MTATLRRWGLPWHAAVNGATDTTLTTLSALNSAVAHTLLAGLVAANGSETITKVGYRQGTTTGTPVANSYKIGIQGISTSTGNPDGTYLGGGSPASVTFTPSNANDSKWVWMTLTNSVSVTRGQQIALILERIVATDASNCISAGSAWSPTLNRPAGPPVGQTNNGTVWTKNTSNPPVMGYGSASNIYGFPHQNTYDATKTFGGTTEAGFTFNVPTSYGSTFQLLGVRLYANTGNTGAKDFIASLYSSPVSGSVTQIAKSVQWDNDQFSTLGSGDRFMEFYFSDSTLPTLNTGTTYGIGFGTTTASESTLICLKLTTSTDNLAWEYSDMGIQYASRTLTSYPPSSDDTNNFTQSNTFIPWAELIVGDVTPPSGGSVAMPVSGSICS